MTKAPANVLPSFEIIKEPELVFHPDDSACSDIHPLRGIDQFGPYSQSIAGFVPSNIRLAIICPEGGLENVSRLIYELEASHEPKERKNYLVSFRGFNPLFKSTFGIPAKASPQLIQIPQNEIDRALKQQEPHVAVGEILLGSLRQLSSCRTSFDIVLIYLPEKLSVAFESKDKDSDYDLHDSIKAVSSGLQMPVQVLNDAAMNYRCRCSVMWRLSLALYAKAGGTPWKMKASNPRHAYVGLGYCVRKSSKKKFVTCCSQIFDGEGANLQFLLYESADGCYDGDNPFLPRAEMRRVMSRTLSLFQKQRGFVPDRLVVHKTTRFTHDEIDGCTDALGAVDDVELLTVSRRTPWKGVKVDNVNQTARVGRAAGYPIERGTAMPIGLFDYLLWTQGNCSTLWSRDYYKEGKGIPFPLRLTRHLGSGDCHQSAEEILGLTKMNWNNDGLYDCLPLSISYASVLARVIKRMGSLSKTPYSFRYFM